MIAANPGRRKFQRFFHRAWLWYNYVRTMRLKHLNLQGFKTFAPKTDLQFGEGLTAVVGPNGSGKSNIADAVRWVLGEQSLSNLRAKKTEDLVFAGSAKRAPLGMAEVSITIDNSDHIVPLDFAEVTLTRRAYRSGENEYYINKSKARLRDVLEVAQALGQAYTVVGQGLVDAALSLRPEERRELFEEAATIRGYFVQREDALRRLGRTEENIARANDLVVELEPQVRRMERQAKQAQDYGKLEAELHSLLKTWYAGRLQLGVAALRKAEESVGAARQAVETRKAALAEISSRLGAARASVWVHLEAASALQDQRTQLTARHASHSQQEAVMRERLLAAVQRRESLAREVDDLQAQSEHIQAQLAQLQTEEQQQVGELASLQEADREVAAQLDALDAEISSAQEAHKERAGRLQALQNRADSLKSRISEAQRRSTEQESALLEAQAAIAALRIEVTSAEEELGERQAALQKAEKDLSEAEHIQSDMHDALARERSVHDEVEGRRRSLVREAESLASQIAALAGEQQAGLYGGVRAVVAAASEGKVPGFVGTVAELLHVPPELEVAVEAALGGRLQEVVMSSWADAEGAIAMLKQKRAGRATFLPLDTLKAGPALIAPKGPGIIGAARDLVLYDPSHRILAELVLGRLLIVEDLPSARSAVSGFSHGAPWTLATLSGEVVRAGGSITGGSNARDADNHATGRTILARERKRRDLAASHRELEAKLHEVDKLSEQAAVTVRSKEAELGNLSVRTEAARKQYLAVQMQAVEQQGQTSRLQQELSWRDGLLADTHKSLASLRLLAEQLSGELAATEQQLAPLRQKLQEEMSHIDRLRAERMEISLSSGASHTRLAVVSEALRSLRSRLSDLGKQAVQVEQRSRALEEFVQKGSEGETALSHEVNMHSAELRLLDEQLKGIEARIAPAETQARTLEAEVRQVEAEQSAAQGALLEAETVYSQATVERDRCEGILESLQREMVEEVGDAVAAGSVAVGIAPTGSMDKHVASLEPARRDASPLQLVTHGRRAINGLGHDSMPVSQVESAEVERRVYALKARLSRLGPVNALAVEEHTALSERHDFLQRQLQDLLAAAESLRRVIGELDRTMRDQFAATFAQVSEAFETFFHTLFGGGTARLELTNPQDVTASGIEIYAQPPGKRMQPLAALSGGERALTSVALLFALLRVRPVPFCVLDEVDAALDESNVARFRSALQELSKQTQFVVITHNRGTIEAANTLYGVSMSGDGTSQLLSLKISA